MENQKTPIDIAFLEGKKFECFNRWAGEVTTVRASGSNINRISNDVFTFTEYNKLPSDETDILDGHYTFFVNYKTFDYLAYKSSDYGSLTYVIPCEFGGYFLTKDNLPEISRKKVEAIIAHKLLGAYFSDHDAVNMQGRNLFSDGTPDVTEYVTRGKYDCRDGVKYSLICDYRGYIWSGVKPHKLSEVELAALKILIGFEQPNIPEFDAQFVKDFVKKFPTKKGSIKTLPITVAGVEYQVVREVAEIYGKRTTLITKDNKFIATEHLDHSLTKFVKAIPTILKNIAQ